MAAAASATTFDAEDRLARALVKDLHTPKPTVYWADLLITALVGWIGFALAAYLKFSLLAAAAAIVSVFAFYRGLCFLHEISHITRREFKDFETVWNVLIGYPLLMPSFVYVGVHQAHHSLSTYGTAADPEYLPFAKSRVMTIAFAAQSFLIPAALLARFMILAPAGLAIPRLRKWLAASASSLTMNLAYRREVDDTLLARIRNSTIAILLFWSVAFIVLPARVFALWFGVVGIASFVNTLRTLGAHRYEAEGDPLDRNGQLLDSIDVPGAPWTEIWAPVGLRYHALHHYFPGIPYHNLREAHRRLTKELPSEAVYRSVRSPGLFASLRRLLSRPSLN